MKYLITGLGNPGLDYVSTRHNIGFLVVEAFAERHKLVFSPCSFGWSAQGRLKNKLFVLLKPDTYMNLSGKAIKHHLQKEKIDVLQSIIITDDLSLPFGKIRIRAKGSDGGHNGLKSIATELQSVDYPRLRFGISAEFSKGKQIDYVLGVWNKLENETLQDRIQLCVDALEIFILEGINNAMNKL